MSLFQRGMSLDVWGCLQRGRSLYRSRGSIMDAMVLDMNQTRLCALEQLRAFLEGTGRLSLGNTPS